MKYIVLTLLTLTCAACAKNTDITPATSTAITDAANASAVFVKIPDKNFEQALIDLKIDTDATLNGQISSADAKNTTSFNVSFKKIKDLTGIEGFTNLKQLMIGYNELAVIDLSKNTALTKLVCHYNNLKGKLDLKNQKSLSTFDALGNGNLITICVNDVSAANANTNWEKDKIATYSTCQ